MVRLAHLSDIHITASPLGWQWQDWFSKRFTSWINHRCLGRGRRFRRAVEVLSILMRDVEQRGIEHMVFSGDATALGFEAEFRRAAELLGVERRPGLAVPGNHDYLTKGAARSGLFERYFAPWQVGLRVDGERKPRDEKETGTLSPFILHPSSSILATYPFAQRLGPVWLVAVNSAVGNFLAFDASGRVGQHQRERLRQLLAELAPGPRILVTHYPICLSDGRSGETYFRGMRDLAEVVKIAAAGGVVLWLHGHRHHSFVLPQCDLAPFPVICVGSGTQTQRWSYNEYILDEHHLQASRRTFDPRHERFQETMAFKIPLASPQPGC